MDENSNTDLIFNQLQHLSLEEFDKLADVVTNDNFIEIKGL